MKKNMVRWSDLPPTTRAVVVAVMSVDVGLRILALADLRKRTADELNGPKTAWAVALALVNSAGALPGAYFLLGRRSSNG